MSARRFTEEDLPQLRKDYRELGGYVAVSKKYGVNKETVRLALKPETRERYNQTTALYAEKNYEKVKLRNRKSTNKYRSKHPERSLLIQAKHRAKTRGIHFNLEETDIVIPKRCPILGVKLQRLGGKRREFSPSLDRVRPSKGYVKGNIAVISWRANNLKNDESDPKIFEAIAAYLRRKGKR